ncbi:unnamed protein product, partial [marine sediment metagenome]
DSLCLCDCRRALAQELGAQLTDMLGTFLDFMDKDELDKMRKDG